MCRLCLVCGGACRRVLQQQVKINENPRKPSISELRSTNISESRCGAWKTECASNLCRSFEDLLIIYRTYRSNYQYSNRRQVVNLLNIYRYCTCTSICVATDSTIYAYFLVYEYGLLDLQS